MTGKAWNNPRKKNTLQVLQCDAQREQLKHCVGVRWAEYVAEMLTEFLFNYIKDKCIELWNITD